MNPSSVSVSALGVRYPRTREPALDDLSLSIGAGERVLVVGPSGAGKSTLLRTLCGVVPQSFQAEVSGRVRVDELDPTTEPVARVAISVGYLGQDPATQVCLPTVESDVALGLENRAVPRDEIGTRVTEALSAMGVAHLAQRRVSTLSGGEQQRVALAAVMVGRPSVLLLDEPTAMLDPGGALDTSRLIAGLGNQPTQVLVDHRLEDVTSLPERTIVLDEDGGVISDGATEDVMVGHAASILASGAWIPLSAELAYITDSARASLLPTEEILADEVTATTLRRLAAYEPPPGPISRESPALSMRSASFAYGDDEVLQKVDLEVRPGEVVAVVGVNGSGKTTLLLGAARLHPLASGELRAPPAAMVFQRPDHQFLANTVADDIAIGMPHPPGETREAAITEALTSTGLDDVSHLNPHRLSGGQKRKLSIASMTALGRPLLLLDEPTYGLDRIDTIATADLIRDVADRGRAVVMATHDLRFAALVADRVVVLAGGTLIAGGPTERVFSDPGVFTEAGLLRPPLLEWWSRQEGVGLRSLVSTLTRSIIPTVL